ncbi:DNAse I-like superfamily protein, partial [Prunus dulcis]
MHSLEPSRPADFRQRFLPTQATVSGDTGPKRTTSLPSIRPTHPQPPSATVVAGNCHETGRVRQFFRNLWELVLLRFSTKSIEHQRSSDQHEKLQRAVEGRGIHHRANHNFRAKGRLCRIFRQKSKENLKEIE